MKIYSISDLHLSKSCNKPMDIFGTQWEGYWDKIRSDWTEKVSDDDIVLICGDISWAMSLEQASADFEDIHALPGKKVILRGNHDYWWSSLSKVKTLVGENIYPLQNDCLRIGKLLLCGSRLWTLVQPNAVDKKILDREYLRLEMSLKKMQAERKQDDMVVGMCHYPPFDATLTPNRFTNLFEQYGVNQVVYGHLHGKDCRAMKRVKIDGVEYLLTSCDQVDNILVFVNEI